jgi:hypothetical protein
MFSNSSDYSSEFNALGGYTGRGTETTSKTEEEERYQQQHIQSPITNWDNKE